MNNLTDLAWVSLQTGKTEFTEGVHTFNGCKVTILKREDPYGFVNGNCRNTTMSARYWGVIDFPNGNENTSQKKEVEQLQEPQDSQLRPKELSTNNKARNTFCHIINIFHISTKGIG